MQLSCPVGRQDMIATNQVNMTPLSENSHISMAPKKWIIYSLLYGSAEDGSAEDWRWIGQRCLGQRWLGQRWLNSSRPKIAWLKMARPKMVWPKMAWLKLARPMMDRSDMGNWKGNEGERWVICSNAQFTDANSSRGKLTGLLWNHCHCHQSYKYCKCPIFPYSFTQIAVSYCPHTQIWLELKREDRILWVKGSNAKNAPKKRHHDNELTSSFF